MAEDWPDRFLKRISELQLSDAEVCRRAGVKATMVADIRRGVRPSVDKVAKLARAVNWSLNQLYSGTEEPNIKLNLLGVSADNEVWADLGPSNAREVALTILNEDIVSIEIGSNEIEGYSVGDIVAGPKTLGGYVDNLIGCQCIIETFDGRRAIKYLQHGSVPGRYTLRSHNPSRPDIPDVKIRWAAPIQIVFKRPR